MSKSIYSLVLDDELVAALDRTANKSGMSRSAVVNDILARAIGYKTQEMRTRSLLGCMQGMLEEHDDFGVFLQDTTLMLRSVLSYRYNPTVKYSLEVRDDCSILRVVVRGRSEQFLALYEQFIRAWYGNESVNGRGDACAYESGKYVRSLTPLTEDPETYAGALSDYVQCFDGALKSFFRAGDERSGIAAVSAAYEAYIKKNGSILV